MAPVTPTQLALIQPVALKGKGHVPEYSATLKAVYWNGVKIYYSCEGVCLTALNVSSLLRSCMCCTGTVLHLAEKQPSLLTTCRTDLSPFVMSVSVSAFRKPDFISEQQASRCAFED